MEVFEVHGYPLATVKADLTAHTAVTVSLSGTTATFTFTAHGYTAGMSVELTGATQTAWNTIHTIDRTTSANTWVVEVDAAVYTAAATGTFVTQPIIHIPTEYMGGQGEAYSSITGTGWSRSAGALLLTCETADVRFALGGANPSINQNTGHILPADGSVAIKGENGVNELRIVQKSSAATSRIQMTPYIADNR